MFSDAVYRISLTPSQIVTVRNLTLSRDLSHYECKELLRVLNCSDWKDFFKKHRFAWFRGKDNHLFRDFLGENLIKGFSFELIN